MGDVLRRGRRRLFAEPSDWDAQACGAVERYDQQRRVQSIFRGQNTWMTPPGSPYPSRRYSLHGSGLSSHRRPDPSRKTIPDRLLPGDGVTEENIKEAVLRAVEEKCDIIFTTSPAFVQESVKAAIANPQLRILNCSLNTSHRYILILHGRPFQIDFCPGIDHLRPERERIDICNRSVDRNAFIWSRHSRIRLRRYAMTA